MCEDCGPTDPAIVEAHEEFEAAIKVFLQKVDLADGIIVDWVLVCSQNLMFEHGSSTMHCWMPRLEQPVYRTKGLLHEVLDNNLASDVAHKTAHHLTGDE